MLPRQVLQARQPVGTALLSVPPTAADVARSQAGVLSREQLRVRGFTASHVHAAVRARRWQTFGRSVVVLSNASLTQAQREWVAVLFPGKPAALCALSAAAAAGLRGFEPEQVHVLVRHCMHATPPRWVKIHESRRFSAGDICTGAELPRALIDAASWSRSPRRACAILCAGVQQRLVTVAALNRELSIAGHIRHVAVMRDILGDIGGGGHTLAEIELGPIASRAGLTAPRRQVLRREPDGRVRYMDVEFDLPDGTVLTVEIDGSAHRQAESWWADLDRQNEIIIGRRLILRYPSVVVRLEPGRVQDQLRRVQLAHLPR